MGRFKGKPGDSEKKGIVGKMKDNWRTITVLLVILAIATFVRVYFAAGAMGATFALSGGSDATYHLRVVRHFVETGQLISWDTSLNYPLGAVNPNPPLFDLMVGIVASAATMLGISPATASSAALACQAPVFGLLACAASYFLGKEITGAKAGGIITALFVALCPISVNTSVLSMGTPTAFVSFLAIMMFYFTVRAVRAADSETDFGGMIKTLKGNRVSLITSVLAGLFMAAIVLTWNGFHILIFAFSMLMAVQLFYDRFTRKDPRPMALFYSVIIMLGLAIASPVFLQTGLFRPLMLGTLLYGFMACVACMAFAETRKIPWLITIPVFAGITVLALVVLYLFPGTLFNDVVYGGNVYGSSQFAELMGFGATRVSTMSIYFGWATLWAGWAAIGLMLLFRKEMKTKIYLFTMSWMLALTILSWFGATLAAIAAPVYGIGLAIVFVWVYKNAGIKEYLASMKASDAVPIWKKILKPIPFLTVLSVIMLVGAPNAMYAIDAGISNEDKEDYNDAMKPLFNGGVFGAIGYNVMTQDNWAIGSAFSTQANVPKDGAMFTWAEYAPDAVTRGGYDTVGDAYGNGAEAVSNMLLASTSDGGVVAVLLIRTASVNDVASLEAALKGAGMSDQDYSEFKAVIDNPASKKSVILADPAKYGIISAGVSDENVMYLYLAKMLTERYGQSKVAAMYDAVSAATGDKIAYGAVGGTMFPLYPQYSSAFLTMAYMNGYIVTDGSVPQFATSSYFGFNYTNEMYDTFLWRSYVGMSPEEAGYSGQFGAYSYFNALSLSDGTAVPHPGFGMSGFEVAYWEVMYNPDGKATHSSDGWVRMTQAAAADLQKQNGGLINYMSGLPLIMKYVGVTGTDASGTVTMAGAPVQGIRVSAVDANGLVRSSAFTGADGKYTVTAPTGGKINFYAGSLNLADGTLIQSANPAATVDYAIAATSLAGTLTGTALPPGATLKLTGTASKAAYSVALATPFSIADMIPDKYHVTVAAADGKTLKESNVTVYQGANTGFAIDLNDADFEFTVKNMYGEVLTGQKVTLNNLAGGAPYEVTAGATETVVKMSVPAGWYYATVSGTAGNALGYVFEAVSSTDVKKMDLVCIPAASPAAPPAAPYYVNGPTFTSVNGTFVPQGIDAATMPVYSFYKVDGANVTWYKTTDAAAPAAVAGHKVSGLLKSAAGNAISGTIQIISSDGRTVSAASGSDGKYGIMLPDGTYTVYAYTSTAAYLGEVTVSGADVTNDVTLGPAYKISGNVKWGTFGMPYLKVLVTVGDGTVVPVATDKAGAYSLMVPDGKKTTVKVEFPAASPFEFKKEDTSTTPTTVTYERSFEQVADAGNTADRTFSFTAYASGKITNSTGGVVKISGQDIAAGADYTFTRTASNNVTVKVDLPGMYFSKFMPFYDGMVLNANNVQTEPYYELTITGCEPTATLEITSSNEGKTTDLVSGSGTATRVYKALGGTTAYEYTAVATSADKTQSAVVNASVTSSNISVAMPAMAKTVTFTGYTGLAESGTLTFTTAEGNKITGKITGGIYTIKAPVSATGNLTFSAEVKRTVNDTEHTYTASRIVDASTVTGTSAVVNLAVTGAASIPVVSNVTLATAIASMDISVLKESKVEFTLNVTMTTPLTVVLSGTGWKSVSFYTDSTKAVPAPVISAAGSVYVVGVFDGTQTAAQDLKVIATDLSGKKAAEAHLSDSDAAWVKTTSGAATVTRGIDVASEREYRYAIKVANTDNYTKTFTVSQMTVPGWYVTLVSADGLTITDLTSGPQTFTVKGQSEETAYVKLTSMSFDTNPGTVPDISVDVKDSASASVLTESFSPAVAQLTLDKTSADGRGALTKLSDIPPIFWGLLTVAVLLLLLILWMGYRRGVFSRRK